MTTQPAYSEVAMVANVYSNGKHTRLRIAVADLEELIMRCGWAVVRDIEGLTDEAGAEVARLEAQGHVTSCGGGAEWWSARWLSAGPCLTPDM